MSGGMPSKKVTRPRGAEKSPKPQYLSRAVRKAFKALDILSHSSRELSLGEIAGSLQLAKSSAARILNTLEVVGYAQKSGGNYSISPDLRRSIPTQLIARLRQAAAPWLKELNRESGETVSLAALFENHIEVLDVVESPEMLRAGNVVGRILPPHASSMGKAITAFHPEATQDRLIRSYGLFRFTPATITDLNDLYREYELIRTQGFAIDREESVAGGVCFAAPVFNEAREAIAAISTSIPVNRLGDLDRQETFIAAVERAAREITHDLARS